MVGYRISTSRSATPRERRGYDWRVAQAETLCVGIAESEGYIYVFGDEGFMWIIDNTTKITIDLASETPYFVKRLAGGQWCVMHRFDGDIRFNSNFGSDLAEAEKYRDFMNAEEKRRNEGRHN